MSVLNKRSPWAIPAAGLILGVISLGLAGCGGSDNTSNPPPVVQIPTTVPAPIILTATQPQGVQQGQGATLFGTVSNPNLFGGATSITAVIPPGVLGNSDTLAIELTPTANGTIVRAQQQGQTGFPTVVAEYVFGSVNGTTIDPSRPVVFNGNSTVTIGLNSSDLQSLQTQLAAGCQLQAWRVQVTPGTQTAQLSRAEGCTASLQTVPPTTSGGSATGNLILTGSCTGDIVVFCVPAHLQGGVGS